MSDGDARDAIGAERVYRIYLETCRRLGVEPVPRERGTALIEGWNRAIAGVAERRSKPH